MTDEKTKKLIVSQIAYLHTIGIKLLIVHGGGIEIKQLLNDFGVTSELVGSHRKTDADR